MDLGKFLGMVDQDRLASVSSLDQDVLQHRLRGDVWEAVCLANDLIDVQLRTSVDLRSIVYMPRLFWERL